MDYKEAKRLLLKNPKLREELQKTDLTWEIAMNVIEARLASGLSQSQLARKVGTKQPSIARIESGNHLPSLSLLEKIAKALKTELIPPTFKMIVKEVEILPELDELPTDSYATENFLPLSANGVCSQIFSNSMQEVSIGYNLMEVR